MTSAESKQVRADQRLAASGTRRLKVVVIGGGISGLAAAHSFVERERANGRETTANDLLLIEASGRAGGTIHTEHRDDFLLEHGPDSFISEKPEALRLARRIGLEANLINTNTEHRRSFIVRDARLCAVPEGFRLLAPTQWNTFLRSPAFSLRGKARMALDLVLPRRRSLEADESLADFVRRRFGREALERMAQPMVGGIYTADPELLSLRATMPRFLDVEREHRSVILGLRRAAKRQAAAALRDTTQQTNGATTPNNNNDDALGTSGARYSLFLSFDSGMSLLTNALASRLPHGSLRLNTRVVSLAHNADARAWRLTTDSGEIITADKICVALPAHRAAQLIRSVDALLADELDAIPYASTATINLAYRREQISHKLDGFGFVVPRIERRALLACTFSSVKFAKRAAADHVLLRAFVGGALQPEMFALDDREMLNRVRQDLNELIGATSDPLFTTITRWQNSMAQYHVGHLERLRRINLRLACLPSLHLLGNAYDGAGIPDCIRRAEEVMNAE